jgi:septal ring factor EnvC (AmiA/AmiB activator)
MEPLVGRKGSAVSACPDQPSYIAEEALTKQPPVAAVTSSGGKGRTALLWTVGSTILSAVGFIALALFEQYNEVLSEMRGDLKHFNETYSTFAKKEELQKCREHMKEMHKELRELHELRTQLEHELKVSEKSRDELAHDMQRLRERMAFVEGQHAVKTNGPN